MGLLNFIFRERKRSAWQMHEDAAAAIEGFISGELNPWGWDDFVSIKKDDPFLESIRLRCDDIAFDFPSDKKGQYCSDAGLTLLREFALSIRERQATLEKEPNQSSQPTRSARG